MNATFLTILRIEAMRINTSLMKAFYIKPLFKKKHLARSRHSRYDRLSLFQYRRW